MKPLSIIAGSLSLAILLILTGLQKSTTENQPAGHSLSAHNGLSPQSQNVDMPSAAVDSDWLATVQKNIKQEEYHISFDEASGQYQSPNRNNNIRFYYRPDGFTAQPRVTRVPLFDLTDVDIAEEDKVYRELTPWKLELTVAGLGRGTNLESFDATEIEVDRHTARAADDAMQVNYTNTSEGMRQDFIVKQRPEGDGNLTVKLDIAGDVSFSVDNNTAVFADASGAEAMRYSDLKVWDAAGLPLEAWMEAAGDASLALVVNDFDAEYPITIDPISTSINWQYSPVQKDAEFGFSVSHAGDVNGDGFGDILVGSYLYDKGQNNEGRIFVFHGSASGTSTLVNWSAESDQAGARFGHCVAAAGDVNGDGFGDVVAGAYQYDLNKTNEGALFLWEGSSIGLGDQGAGLPTNADWEDYGQQANANYGISVACAGDVNGDGFSDIIAGAHNYNAGKTDEGIVYVFHGSSTGPSLTCDWLAESNQASAKLGRSVASAGDVNGDGFSDVIIGAFKFNNGKTDEGIALIYHGSATGLLGLGGGGTAAVPGSANWLGEGDQATAYYGFAVGSAGDVNGDGYSDVIVGAYLYNNGQNNEGLACVYHGGQFGVQAPLGQNGNPGNADWTAEANQGSAELGREVGMAGDVNGDGYSDVLLAAHLYDDGQSNEGAAWVYLGGANGLGDDGTPDNADWEVQSNQAGAKFGRSISTAGDVNGDGYSDILVGAYHWDDIYSNAGRAFVYHGGPYGPTATAAWTSSGSSTGTYGFAIAGAGDVNGDGYEDILLGDYFFDNGHTNEGRALLFLGSATGPGSTADWSFERNSDYGNLGFAVAGAGDVNGDGFADVIIGSPAALSTQPRAYVFHGSATGLGSTQDWLTAGQGSLNNYGISVASAGDVNGDGYSDVIVGDWRYTNGENNEGRAYVYHGSASGLSTTADWTQESNQIDAFFGRDVSGAGDVNGDGFSDVAVGASNYDNGQTDEGSVFVYHGSSGGLSSTANWTAEADQASADFGYAVSAAGDVNGDGYSDLAIGARTYDNGQTDEGAVFLWEGSATGLGANGNPGNADWSVESDVANAEFGVSLASAGDVDADGTGDLLVGADEYSNGQSGEGAAFLYLGSSSGLSSSADWSIESDQASAALGRSVASAGDVDGDGDADILVSAPLFNASLTDDGQVSLFLGNSGAGVGRLPQQFRPSSSTAIIAALRSTSQSEVRLRFFGRSFFGRVDATPQYEVIAFGNDFSAGTLIDGTESDLGLNGLTFTEDIDNLSSNTLYKWRARLEFDIAGGAPQRFSAWIYSDGASGLGEADFRTDAAPKQAFAVGGTDAGASRLSLLPAYPNPAQRQVTISFALADQASVRIDVYDARGVLQLTALQTSELQTGSHTIRFEADGLNSGEYFYTVIAGDERSTGSFLLLR